MSQKNNTVNFLIQDANGQPQMVKVVKAVNNQPLTQIKIKPNPVKLIKLNTSSEGPTQVQGPVYQTIKLSGLNCTSNFKWEADRNRVKWTLRNCCLPITVINIQPADGRTDLPSPFLEKQFLRFSRSSQLSNMLRLHKNLATYKELVQVPAETLARFQQVVPKTEPQEVEEPPEIELVETLPELIPLGGAGGAEPITVTSGGGMSHTTRRRHDSDHEPPQPEYTTKRRKHADKVGKGLRHFSMKVCEKVRTKGFTSYNEVADELVLEFASGIHGSADSQQYDQKNIRRRVYDALNVLMAMNIISKDKKEIRWLGLPTNSVQECTSLEREKQAKLEQIQKKTQQLQELILQHISFKSLIERNKDAESRGVKPSPSSAIHLPFIVVNTSDKALIDCSISNDKTEYMFNFNKRFQIHDDIDILKRMGLLFGLDKGECSEEQIARAKSMIPKSLESYVEQMGRGVNMKLSQLLEEADAEGGECSEGEGSEEALDEEAAEGDEPAERDYSDDSSDVDV